ncbi:MAG: helix-turn-helix domain-containing protein [Ruminococcaceae bacterium]|nr:helix-turn-helix domain-containing protein [Oscillospiraceae bacterium]
MESLLVKHDYPERAGFKIHRPTGRKDYTFLHFEQKMTIEICGETVVTEPNACILYSPDVPQLFYSEKNDIIHNWMHFSADLRDVINRFNIPENKIIYPNECKFISRLFYKMETELNSNKPFKNQLLNAYFNEFFIRFSRSLNSKKSTLSASSNEIKRLQNIRKKALSALEHSWTVEELAKLANLSASRFHAVYKEIFGISPIKDIIENRLQTAKNLLVATDYSVTEISERLGYLNTNHFIRQFKAFEKQTPFAYRKNHS